MRAVDMAVTRLGTATDVGMVARLGSTLLVLVAAALVVEPATCWQQSVRPIQRDRLALRHRSRPILAKDGEDNIDIREMPGQKKYAISFSLPPSSLAWL